MAKHTQEEIEAFAQEYVLNEDQTAAYLKAKPNTKSKAESLHSLASRMAKHKDVQKRVAELRESMKVKAESRFGITVEQRLRWLKDIVDAGLGVYTDSAGSSRRENLAAARAAIATMNEMIGVDDGQDDQAKPMTFTFQVQASKGKIETTNVERD